MASEISQFQGRSVGCDRSNTSPFWPCDSSSESQLKLPTCTRKTYLWHPLPLSSSILWWSSFVGGRDGIISIDSSLKRSSTFISSSMIMGMFVQKFLICPWTQWNRRRTTWEYVLVKISAAIKHSQSLSSKGYFKYYDVILHFELRYWISDVWCLRSEWRFGQPCKTESRQGCAGARPDWDKVGSNRFGFQTSKNDNN